MRKTKQKELVRQGLASLALEGMFPSKEMQADVELLLADKITADEFYARCVAKVKKAGKTNEIS